MRGWTILVLVVVGAWFLIVGPPANLEPTDRAVPHSHYDLICWLYFTAFPYPGKWVLLHIWSGFFSLSWAEFFHGAGWSSILVAVFSSQLGDLITGNLPPRAADIAGRALAILVPAAFIPATRP